MNLRREAVNALWAIWPRATTVSAGGRRFRVPLQRGFDRRLLHRDRELWLDSVLRTTLAAPDSLLIDVGANCGQTLLKAKAIQPEVRYLGIEPNPACAGYLQHVIQLNRLEQCSVFACGLGAEPGVSQLHTAAPADPSATVIANFRGADTGPIPLTVLIEKGDDLVVRLGLSRIDLIKIDAEGAEAGILAGLRNTIERHQPTITSEVLRSYDASHPTHELRSRSKREIGALLGELCYRIFAIDQDERRPVTELSDQYLNYLFLPANAAIRATRALVE